MVQHSMPTVHSTGRHRDEKRVSTHQAFCGDTWKNNRLLADVLHGNKKSWRPATNIHKRKHAKTAMEGPIFPQPCGYGLDWLDSWPTQGRRGIQLLNHGSCVPQPRWHDQKSTCCLSGNKMSRRNPVSGMLPFCMWRCSHRLPLLRSLIIDLISSPCLPGNSVRLWFFAGKLHTTKSQWHGEGLSTGTYFWIYYMGWSWFGYGSNLGTPIIGWLILN